MRFEMTKGQKAVLKCSNPITIKNKLTGEQMSIVVDPNEYYNVQFELENMCIDAVSIESFKGISIEILTISSLTV